MSKEEEICRLRHFLGRVADFLYEEKNLEEISINYFSEAILLFSNGRKEVRDTELKEIDWEIIFYYLSNNFESKEYELGSNLVITLPNQHRFNGSLGNGTKGNNFKNKISVSIRIFKSESECGFRDFKIDKIIERFLKQRIIEKDNIFVSGSTSAGKTTFMNLLIRQIAMGERIISVEDTWELKIPHHNSVQMMPVDQDYEQVLDFLLKSTPDRLLLGELSTKNVHAVEKFITSGHKGFMMTMHADSPYMAITDSFFAKFSANMKEVTSFDKEIRLLRETVDLVIQLKQTVDKKRVLTDIYFPKEDKNYSFPSQEAEFKMDRVGIKPVEEIEEVVAEIIKANKTIILKDIGKELGISYRKLKRMIPARLLKKNIIKDKIYKRMNLGVNDLYKKINKEGITVSKKRIRQIKKELIEEKGGFDM